MGPLNALFIFRGIPKKISKNIFIIRGCRYCSTSSNENKIQLLNKLTGCSLKDAAEIVTECKSIDKIDEERIKESYSILQSFDILNSDIVRHLRVLMMHPVTLKNHIMVLEEAGFKKDQINSYTVCRFYTLLKSSVESLKNQGFIDVNTDVCSNYSEILGLPSEFQEIHKDNTLLSRIHISNISALLKWKSNGVWGDTDVVARRLNYKSVQLISRTFDLLTNEFRLTAERICKYPLFLSMKPDNIENILKYVPTLADTDVRDVVTRWPKILLNNYKSLIAIDNYLKEFGLSQKAILRYPSIYTLDPETVHNRLKNVANDQVFLQWKYHPKFLSVVVYHHKYVDRLKIMKVANMQCVSLHLLGAREIEFRRHVEYLDKSNQQDVLTFLSLSLCVDIKQIRKRLKKHPYWLYIPHKDIQETLLFLQKERFTNEEIISSIIIVLYPKNVVAEELSKLDSKSYDCCRNSISGGLRRETILPLILYAIEMPFHFNKDAVWAYKNKETNSNERSSSYLISS